MDEAVFEAFGLAFNEFLIVGMVCLLAGVVRGFTGFALSAVIMAGAALFIAPIELIPALWWMEVTSSLLMLRGGWRDADRSTTLKLIGGSILGLPIGFALTVAFSADVSRLVALSVVAVLAGMLLARVRIPMLSSPTGTLISGTVSGIVTGVSGVGGLVVAIYVLAQNKAARSMRGSLIIYLLGTSMASLVVILIYGLMDEMAVRRGLCFAIPVGIGVIAGRKMFVPRWEAWYKPICLWLLVGLALVGIMRLVL